MQKIKSQIPNLLTLGNLICGGLAVSFVFQGEPKLGVYLVILGMLFDFLDGFVARLLKVSSPLGGQLDSLADLISFGFFPSVLVNDYLYSKTCNGDCNGLIPDIIYPYLGFVILAASAYRLAKFNLDSEQTYNFKGIPTPINCFFICALPFLLEYESVRDWVYFSKTLLIVIYIQAILLISDRPFLALKFKSFSMKENWNKYLLLLVSAVSLITLREVGVILIYAVYIILSLTTIRAVKRSLD